MIVATLEAPLTGEAARFGVDSAVEAGQPLLVVNAVESLLAPCGLVLGYDYVAPPDVEESLRSPAVLAHSLGVQVERFCLRSPRPVDALLDFVVERSCGLLVVGPDRKRKTVPHCGHFRAVALATADVGKTWEQAGLGQG